MGRQTRLEIQDNCIYDLGRGEGAYIILRGLIHHFHKWPPCNFETFKMSATKDRIEYQERSCQNESLCVALGSYSYLT